MECRKRDFLSKQDAKKFMRRNNAERKDEPPLMSCYKCLRCGNWHVSHVTKKVGRSLVRRGILYDDSAEGNEELNKLRASVQKHQPRKKK